MNETVNSNHKLSSETLFKHKIESSLVDSIRRKNDGKKLKRKYLLEDLSVVNK